MRILLAIFCFVLLPMSGALADDEAGKIAYDAGDYETAYKEWLPLAEAGDVEAAHKIGYMYSEGVGFTKNFLLAEKWFLLAAKGGKLSSKKNLARIYS